MEGITLDAAQRGCAVVAAMFLWLSSVLDTVQLLSGAGCGSADDSETLLQVAAILSNVDLVRL